MFKYWKYLGWATFLYLVLLTSAYILPGHLEPKHTDNQLIKKLKSGYNETIKIGDIAFLPLSIFYKDKIPTVWIQLSSKDNEGHIHWNDYESQVRMKSLGTDSFSIKLPNGEPFQGTRSFVFRRLSEKTYEDVFQSHRARQLGYLARRAEFVRLKVNGANLGVFVAYQDWDEELLEGTRIPDDSSIYQIAFSADRIEGTIITGADQNNMLKLLGHVLYQASDEDFVRMIDNFVVLESLYTCRILRSKSTQIPNETILLYNPSIGKFQYISTSNNCVTDDLSKRILGLKNFQDNLKEAYITFVNNKERIENNRQAFREIQTQSNGAILRDLSKLTTNGSFLRLKDNVIDSVTTTVSEPSFISTQKKQNPIATFFIFPDRTNDIFTESATFLENNKQFNADSEGNIILKGTKIFSHNVIVPEGYKLKILEGTNIFLEEDVSIVSYSPVEIMGTESQPVKFQRASEKPWGSFAVIDNNGTSTIKFTSFSGGSGTHINGVTYTGMVAFHKASVEISHVKFENGSDDDGLNVKMGTAHISNSYFAENFSDAIDIDFADNGTIIKDNNFKNNGYGGGGDGIDISWSDIIISNNNIDGCTDKGVSVGESSQPHIVMNTIRKCDIGIAVKDNSKAIIDKNTFIENRVGISAYEKKAAFGGGVANVSNSTFIDTPLKYEVDNISEIKITEI